VACVDLFCKISVRWGIWIDWVVKKNIYIVEKL